MNGLPVGMKLFVALWLIMATRGVGAALASRHCMRLRKKTPSGTVYEWLTAFGVGLALYALSDFLLIWDGISNVGPDVSGHYSVSFLVQSLTFQLVQTIGVWVMALVVMDGNAPGKLRSAIFFVLRKAGLMRPPL